MYTGGVQKRSSGGRQPQRDCQRAGEAGYQNLYSSLKLLSLQITEQTVCPAFQTKRILFSFLKVIDHRLGAIYRLPGLTSHNTPDRLELCLWT